MRRRGNNFGIAQQQVSAKVLIFTKWNLIRPQDCAVSLLSLK